MTIHHAQDAVLFRLDGLELRQLLETHSMVYAIWLEIVDDWPKGERTGGWTPRHPPMKVVHEAQGHLLECRLNLWRYFRKFDSTNALERQIRGEMMALGLSGVADRRSRARATDSRNRAD
jgi:hypothetical protein